MHGVSSSTNQYPVSTLCFLVTCLHSIAVGGQCGAGGPMSFSGCLVAKFRDFGASRRSWGCYAAYPRAIESGVGDQYPVGLEVNDHEMSYEADSSSIVVLILA